MPKTPESMDRIRRGVELAIQLQGLTRKAVAEATGIKRPNLVGWLNQRNGISEEKLLAVLRTVHLPKGILEDQMIHRWSVSDWDEAREMLDITLVAEEKQHVEIFHLGRRTASPVAILRCACEVPNGDYPAIPVHHLIVLTPAPLAPSLGPLTDSRLGFGVMRAEEPAIASDALPNLSYRNLAMVLAKAYCEGDPPQGETGLLDDLLEVDSALESELYQTMKAAGRECTRYVLGLAAKQPAMVKALQNARRAGFTDTQILGWVGLLADKPEFCRVLVDGVIRSGTPTASGPSAARALESGEATQAG